MKRTIFIILAFAGAITTTSATQVPSEERKQLMIATPEGPNIGLAATTIQRQAPVMNVVRLRGDVEIRTKDMILHADEADYDANTGEIEARGTVRIKLEAQR